VKYHWDKIDLTEKQREYINSVYREMEAGSYRKTIKIMDLNVKNKRVLDVGCGPGQFLVELSKDSPSLLVGCDLDESFLRFAFNEFTNRNINNFILIRADAMNLPFANETFDVVTSFLVLPLLRNDKEALIELSRVLKIDGTLCISIHAAGLPIRYIKQGRFRPLLIYPITCIYQLTGKKLILNTIQNHKKISKILNSIGLHVDKIIPSKKSFGLVETFKIRAIKLK